MQIRSSTSIRLAVMIYGGIWALAAAVSLAQPWFVVFAVLLWVSAPLYVVVVAGLVALDSALRAAALSMMRAVVMAFAVSIIPSALVVWGAVAQMGDDYF